MMSLTWNWVAIALSLTAALPEAANPGAIELKTSVGKLRQISGNNPDGPQITYRIRVLEMDGLDWRTAWFEELTPVARQGNATIWTAPVRAAGPIVKMATRLIASPPKITAASRGAAHISTRKTRSLVSQVSWNGDEPSTLTEAVREGMAATVVGRRIDQGILAQIVVEDTELRQVHQVKLASSEKRMAAAEGQTKMSREIEGDHHVLQVPEFASREVAGEWLIPNDGALLVSFGVHTAAGPNGKAVVRERLMLIEATDTEVPRTASRREPTPGNTPLPSPSTIPAPVTPSPSTIPAPVTPSPSTIPMPTPSIPSRSLPQGIHADGTPAELPPLPEETAPLESDASAEPHASPQIRPTGPVNATPEAPKQDAKDKTIDPRSTKAGYNRGQWSQVKPQSLPASLDRWIESMRVRGDLMKECSECEESECSDECKDED